MPFLASIGAWILEKMILPVIESAVGSLLTKLYNYLKSKLAMKQAEDKNNAIADKSEKAKTPEERKDAAEDTLNNI